MKQFYTFIAAMLTAVAASAQTWSLVGMTDDDFANGGTSQWHFEKYTYATGQYTQFVNFAPFSTANYVDIYQPERVGGMLIQNLEDVVPDGEFTWVYYKRTAWYDTEWTASSRADANAKFVYVSRLPELANAIEVCGNQEFTPAMSFTAPQDGYYKVQADIIRQDGANLTAINVVPRFRAAGTDHVDADVSLGLEFPFGAGGELIEGVVNNKLEDGAEQRFTPQQSTAFTCTFYAKQGDIISFEVNYYSLPASAWPRDYYPRAFYKQLDITLTDEASAKADEHFVDPYDETQLNAMREQLNAYMDRLSTLNAGTEVGDVPEEKWNEFDQLLDQYDRWIADGTINATNVAQYVKQLEQAWARLQSAVIRYDVQAEGNYCLFAYDVQADGTFQVTNNPDAMAENTNLPWGFYARNVGNGTLEQLENHDANNKATESAWYKGSGDWFYITDQGAMHPMTNRAPAIMFTAPDDGTYRIDLTLYRPNPNPSVENPLYIRWFHLYDGAENVAQSEQAVLSEQYGSVANDGEGGKKPVSTAFYAYLKAGDRLFFEIDCYTANRNSSAGTQILSLTAMSHVTDYEPITPTEAKESGLLFINPYAAGDCTQLRQIVAEAENTIATTQVGAEPGLYPQEAADELQSAVALAHDMLKQEGDPALTQGLVDEMAQTLQRAIATYLASRNPVTLQPEGQFSIQLAGTERFLTRKNSAGDHYYANVIDAAGVEADMAKNGTALDDYTWTFTFTPVEGTNTVTITTDDGYLTADGYVRIGDTAEAPAFTLACENAGDELFAIRRPDGLYLTSSFAWKSPYDIIGTSATPQYIWQLSTATVTAVEALTSAPATAAASKYVYDLSGRRVSHPTRGIYIQNGRKVVRR